METPLHKFLGRKSVHEHGPRDVKSEAPDSSTGTPRCEVYEGIGGEFTPTAEPSPYSVTEFQLLKTRYGTLLAEKRALSEEHAQCEDEKDKLKDELDKCRRAYDKSQRDNQKLRRSSQEQSDRWHDEKKQLQDNLATTQAELRIFRNRDVRAKEEIEGLKNKAAEDLEKIGNLQTERDTLKRDMFKLRADLKKATSELFELRMRNEESDRIQARNVDLTTSLKKLQKNYQEEMDRRVINEEEVMHLRSENKSLKSKTSLMTIDGMSSKCGKRLSVFKTPRRSRSLSMSNLQDISSSDASSGSKHGSDDTTSLPIAAAQSGMSLEHEIFDWYRSEAKSGRRPRDLPFIGGSLGGSSLEGSLLGSRSPSPSSDAPASPTPHAIEFDLAGSINSAKMAAVEDDVFGRGGRVDLDREKLEIYFRLILSWIKEILQHVSKHMPSDSESAMQMDGIDITLQRPDELHKDVHACIFGEPQMDPWVRPQQPPSLASSSDSDPSEFLDIGSAPSSKLNLNFELIASDGSHPLDRIFVAVETCLKFLIVGEKFLADFELIPEPEKGSSNKSLKPAGEPKTPKVSERISSDPICSDYSSLHETGNERENLLETPDNLFSQATSCSKIDDDGSATDDDLLFIGFDYDDDSGEEAEVPVEESTATEEASVMNSSPSRAAGPAAYPSSLTDKVSNKQGVGGNKTGRALVVENNNGGQGASPATAAPPPPASLSEATPAAGGEAFIEGDDEEEDDLVEEVDGLPKSGGPSGSSSKKSGRRLRKTGLVTVAPAKPAAAVESKDPRSLKKYVSLDETTRNTPEFNFAQVHSFPSLPPAYLTNCNANDVEGMNPASLSAQEVETHFNNILIAFKTDRHTLSGRLELQKRHRDNAEANMDVELQGLKASFQKLWTSANLDSSSMELVGGIQTQIDVVQQSASRISSAAEVYGQVQQENKVSKMIDILMAHVENQKRAYEREHAELEEMRKLLSNNLGPDSEDAYFGSNSPSGGMNSSSNGCSMDEAQRSPRLRTLSMAATAAMRMDMRQRASAGKGNRSTSVSERCASPVVSSSGSSPMTVNGDHDLGRVGVGVCGPIVEEDLGARSRSGSGFSDINDRLLANGDSSGDLARLRQRSDSQQSGHHHLHRRHGSESSLVGGSASGGGGSSSVASSGGDASVGDHLVGSGGGAGGSASPVMGSGGHEVHRRSQMSQTTLSGWDPGSRNSVGRVRQAPTSRWPWSSDQTFQFARRLMAVVLVFAAVFTLLVTFLEGAEINSAGSCRRMPFFSEISERFVKRSPPPV